MLNKNARLIVTDSGGVQKEAFFHRAPCVTLRHETEWIELVETGWNRLAPLIASDVIQELILEHIDTPGKMAVLYGDGRAANHIAYILWMKGPQ